MCTSYLSWSQWTQSQLVTCAPARQLCCKQVLFLPASTSLSVRRKSKKLLVVNRCNLVGICLMGNPRSGWNFMTFDLDLWPWELLSHFFQLRLYLSHRFTWQLFRYGDTSSEYLGHGCFKVMGLRSRSWQRKGGSVQLKNYWLQIAGTWSEYLLQ